MTIYEIGTGYTPIPARMGAATEIVVEELTRAFRNQNVPVQIIDIKAKDRTATDLPIQEVWVPACFSGTDVKLGLMHKLKRVAYSVSLAFALRKLLKNADEKVVLHFHNQYNLFFFLKLVSPKLRTKAHIAYTVHSYIWPGKWEEIEETVKKRYFQEIYCVQHADDVLVLNDKTTEHFVRHLGVEPERIHKITNGVNTDTYNILPPEETSDLYRDKKVVFQVGSVCDRKNQLGAVKMLAPYLQKNPDVVYAYAGGVIDEAYQQSILDYAVQQGILEQVRYVGELPPGKTLNLHYNAASVTVFPSKVESFGLVIIESLCAGTPVLMPEKPIFDLNEGYQVYSDEETFTALVDAAIGGSYDKNEVRREAAQAYSWDQVAQKHLETWQS